MLCRQLPHHGHGLTCWWCTAGELVHCAGDGSIGGGRVSPTEFFCRFALTQLYWWCQHPVHQCREFSVYKTLPMSCSQEVCQSNTAYIRSSGAVAAHTLLSMVTATASSARLNA